MTALMRTSGLVDDVCFGSSYIPHLQQCPQDDKDDPEKNDPDPDPPRGLKPLQGTGIDPVQHLDLFLGQQRISPRETQTLDAAVLFFGSGLLSQYAEEMKNEYVTNKQQKRDNQECSTLCLEKISTISSPLIALVSANPTSCGCSSRMRI